MGSGIDSRFDDLVEEIRAVRPAPSDEFTDRLDGLVGEGFPKETCSRSRRVTGETWRRVLAPLATAAAALLLVFVGLNGLDVGGTESLRSVPDSEVVVPASEDLSAEAVVDSRAPGAESSGDGTAAGSEGGGPGDVHITSSGTRDETAAPANAGPVEDRADVDSRDRDGMWLTVVLIAAGVALLSPALWFASAPLRRRYRERVLDW